MTSLMPDSNVWIDILRSDSAIERVNNLRKSLDFKRLMMSSIVRFEIETGIQGRHSEGSGKTRLAHLLQRPFIILIDFSHDDASFGAQLAARARAVGRQLSLPDALIAGHARSTGALLLTADRRLIDALGPDACVDWNS
jgi:predicted nucleic acid-binding protein